MSSFVLIHHAVTSARLVSLHSMARSRFTADLHRAYPDPDHAVRAQVDPMLDRWWPHAESPLASRFRDVRERSSDALDR